MNKDIGQTRVNLKLDTVANQSVEQPDYRSPNRESLISNKGIELQGRRFTKLRGCRSSGIFIVIFFPACEPITSDAGQPSLSPAGNFHHQSMLQVGIDSIVKYGNPVTFSIESYYLQDTTQCKVTSQSPRFRTLKYQQFSLRRSVSVTRFFVPCQRCRNIKRLELREIFRKYARACGILQTIKRSKQVRARLFC